MTFHTAVNQPLLRETMDTILAKPEAHNQEFYARRTECGTAYCFAGTALVLSGEDFAFSSNHYGEVSWDLASGKPLFITACMILGIRPDDAMTLFHGDNTVEDLKHMVDVLCTEGTLDAAS